MRFDTLDREIDLGLIIDDRGRHSSRRAHFKVKIAKLAKLICVDQELFPKVRSVLDIVKDKLHLTKS